MASSEDDNADVDRSSSGEGGGGGRSVTTTTAAVTPAGAGDSQALLTLELRGAATASSTASLVRGFAALYGDHLQTTFSGDPEDDSDSDAVSTIVTTTASSSSSYDSSSRSGSSDAGADGHQTTEVLRGRDALVRWMKAQLERRLLAPPPTVPTVAAARSPLLPNDAERHERRPPSPPPPPPEPEPLRIFVSGDRSQVGKSTVCLGLVGALLRHGFAASDVAYIKPATQCEQPQLVAKFCRARGVACTDIGPIVFYAGFTREFLLQRTESADALLAQAREAVAAVGRGKKVVVVDGVGYPAVGSICGVSNAAVARAVEAPVVLVGKRGVGDAVDSFNLNASFFEREGVKVLGTIFNRLPRDGYYSLENCRESVTAYFDQYQPHKHVYGFIPEMEQTEEEREDVGAAPCDGDDGGADDTVKTEMMTPTEAKQAKKVIDTFYEHVNLKQLLEDVERNQSLKAIGGGEGRSPSRSAAPKRVISVTNGATTTSNGVPLKRSRADIQAAARASGAAGG